MVVCFSSLYDYAKENSGPLKPGVQTVEGTVKTVIGPVYEKFRDVPFDLLKFVDRKVFFIVDSFTSFLIFSVYIHVIRTCNGMSLLAHVTCRWTSRSTSWTAMCPRC